MFLIAPPALDISQHHIPLAVGLALFFSSFLLVLMREDLPKKIQRAFARLCVVATISGLAILIIGSAIELTMYYDARDAHTATVSNWLSSDYGIKLDDEKVLDLVNGSSYVVDYDGSPIAIRILETADDRLSVVDSQQMVLAPVR
jgi:hypothetical protein